MSLSCQTVFRRVALPDTTLCCCTSAARQLNHSPMSLFCPVDDFARPTRDLRRSLPEPMFECRNWKSVHQVAGSMREKISNRELTLIFGALTVAGCLMIAGVVLALGRLLSV